MLDVQTLGLAFAAVTALMAALALYLALARPSYAGRRSWALGILLLGLGMWITTLRTPQNLVTVVVSANGLCLVGGVFMVAAYRRFSDWRFPLEALLAALTLPFTAGLWYFVAVQDLPAVRLHLSGGYFLLCLLVVLAICLEQMGRRPALRSSYVINLIGVLATLLCNLPRLRHPATAAALQADSGTALLYLGLLVGVLGCSFGQILLHDDRRRLELAELQARLHELSHTDPLTGVHNRRALLERFSQLSRTAAALALVVVDIDHFKALNDCHGHEVGDRCLRQLTAVLRACVQSGDLIARYGGEEFVLLLHTTERSAGETLREVRRLLLSPPQDTPGFTISAGLTTVTSEDSFETAFSRADQALYGAKTNGRNRDLRAESLPGGPLSWPEARATSPGRGEAPAAPPHPAPR